MSPAEFSAHRGHPDVLGPRHRSPGGAIDPTAAGSLLVDDFGDALSNPPQGGAVLGVVGDKFLLDGIPAARLPRPSPRYTLGTGGVATRPSATKVGTHVFQPIRVSREVDSRVDDREHVT